MWRKTMKKKLSMILALVLTLCLVLSLSAVLVGCDDLPGDGPEEEIDPNRTQLRIGNYYGGLGDGWLNELKRQYEKLHPDVQILITNDKPSFTPDQLKNSIATDKHQLYFVEKQYYYDLVNDGKLADVTDVVTEKLTKYGEDVSIAEKISDDTLREYYGGKTTGNKYYGLPSYMSHSGIVYDVDLWENKGFYIADGSTDTNVKYTKGDNKSAGPDGVKGTRDDGMPATYEQFKKLVKKITASNVTPFIWSGGIGVYQTMATTAWWADYEGYDNFLLNYTFSGSYTFDGDSKPTQITEANAYMLQKQRGKKYALQFAKDLVTNPNNYTLSSGGTTKDHLGAQYEFIKSYPSSQPVAMILESDWWENEARNNNAFSDMVPKYGEKWAYGTRRFAYMPVPKTTGSAQGETVVSTSATCCFFINANAGDKMDLAKDFYQFCHTENSLRVFNAYTGLCRPFNYTLTDEQYEGLTYFSKYIYDMYKGENPAKVVYDIGLCNTRLSDVTYFRDRWEWNANVGSVPYDNPFKAFASDSSLTVDSYFNGLFKYHSENWSRFGL